MESHGSTFLQQISNLKHQIDDINEEIEAKIRGTREIESAIVHSSEKEQAALSDVEKWTEILVMKECQHSDLLAVTAAKLENVAEQEARLHSMENRRDELRVQIEKARDAFIASCRSFLQHQEMGDRPGDAYSLIPLKSNLLCEVESLKKDVKAVRFTDEALYQSKVERFRQLQNVNAELQNEIDAENAQNEHLLRRIEGLNDALVNVPGCQDISRLEEDFDIFSEEKRNLEDGIVTLQQQLPLLLSQEQKLGNLLKDQQKALQSLEQKIEEVKLLKEAYENDFQNHVMDDFQNHVMDEMPQNHVMDETPRNPPAVPNPQNYNSYDGVLLPADRRQSLHGTWDSHQTQPTKRHRLM